jgi:putative peptidoglycan lipid II flippase
VAGYFGTSATLDTFIVAFTVPEIISFVVFAALPISLVPFLRRLENDRGQEVSGLFWGGAIAFGVTFAIISLLIYHLRGSILFWIAPTLDGVQSAQGDRIISILAWFVFFRGMESYFRGWLFARKHFLVPATSSIVINFIILAAIYLLYGKLNILSLAYGWLIGSAVLFLYNGSFACRIVRPVWQPGSGLFAAVTLLRVTAVIALIESIALVYPVVDRLFASRLLGEGQISALRYALFLIHIPTGIFVVAFSLATFPWISDLSVDEEQQRLVDLYQRSVRLLLFVMMPVALGVVVFANEILLVAFKRGAFDLSSLELTAPTLMYYALGIVFYSIYLFQMRFYYAHALYLRLTIFLLSLLALKIGMSAVLIGPMEHNGLALATSIAWFSGFTIMTLHLGNRLRISIRELFIPALPRMMVALFCVLPVWLVLIRFWPHDPHDSLWLAFVRLTTMAIIGLTTYGVLGKWLKLPEVDMMLEHVRARLAD